MKTKNKISEEKKEIPNAVTIAALQEFEDMKNHPENYKVFSSVEELMEDLNSEDD